MTGPEGAPTVAPEPAAGEAVEALAARYWDASLALRPVTATYYGDDRFDDRLDDPSPAGRAAFRQLQAATLAELDALGASPDAEAAVTADLLRFLCLVNLALEDSDWPAMASIDQMDGPQVTLSQLAQVQPFEGAERLDRWEARLTAYPAYLDAHAARIADARARGIVPARIVAQRVAEQLERVLAEPTERSPLVVRATRDPAITERLARAVEGHVVPAYRRFLEAVRASLPASRAEPGLVAIPGGEAMYEARVRQWTTIEVAPGTLHRQGLDELEEIEEERQTIAAAAGFGTDTRAYRRALATEPGNVPGSAEQLLGRMREDLARAWDAAPGWFGRLPAASCAIEPLDTALEADSLGHYVQPTADGTRGGTFYMNTSDLPQRLFSRYATVTYHETIPGHHLQLALEAERPDLSAFRRQGAHAVSGAYVEGWGLYSERLADEMELFRDPGERFGMLDAQAWRAARLVVDTGIHAFGWDRERGIDLFEEATGFDRDAAAIEVDRYIAIPAQALAYKVGQREIERLRREHVVPGQGVDLRRFHEELLGHGSLPLAVLAAHLPRWLEVPA